MSEEKEQSRLEEIKKFCRGCQCDTCARIYTCEEPFKGIPTLKEEMEAEDEARRLPVPAPCWVCIRHKLRTPPRPVEGYAVCDGYIAYIKEEK